MQDFTMGVQTSTSILTLSSPSSFLLSIPTASPRPSPPSLSLPKSDGIYKQGHSPYVQCPAPPTSNLSHIKLSQVGYALLIPNTDESSPTLKSYILNSTKAILSSFKFFTRFAPMKCYTLSA